MPRVAGFKHSKQTILNMSNAKKGKIFTQNHKDNLAKALKGLKHPWVKPPADRTKANENLPKGEKHWNWQGGKTPQIVKERNSGKYKLWRKSVFERDGYACVLCGAKSRKGASVYLEANHIKPFAHFPELRFDINNGRTLCKGCHSKTDTYKIKSKINFNNQYSKKRLLENNLITAEEVNQRLDS